MPYSHTFKVSITSFFHNSLKPFQNLLKVRKIDPNYRKILEFLGDLSFSREFIIAFVNFFRNLVKLCKIELEKSGLRLKSCRCWLLMDVRKGRFIIIFVMLLGNIIRLFQILLGYKILFQI